DDSHQHDILRAAVALGYLHRDPLERAPELSGVECDVGRGAHRGAQKKSRLRKQPGPEMYTFIVVPFRYLSSVLKVTRIYDRDGFASTPRARGNTSYAPRLRSSFRRRWSWSRVWTVIRSSKRSNLRARLASDLLVCLSSAPSLLAAISADAAISRLRIFALSPISRPSSPPETAACLPARSAVDATA